MVPTAWSASAYGQYGGQTSTTGSPGPGDYFPAYDVNSARPTLDEEIARMEEQSPHRGNEYIAEEEEMEEDDDEIYNQEDENDDED